MEVACGLHNLRVQNRKRQLKKVAKSLFLIMSNDLSMLIAFVMDRLPLNLPLKYCLAEGEVLSWGGRQDAEEPAASLMEASHVVGSGQLTVGQVVPLAQSACRASPGWRDGSSVTGITC